MEGGEEGNIDDAFAAPGFDNIGAWIMGRNMFGPVRGPWPDESWRGWWGDDPPFHHPVFVLTHHPRLANNELKTVRAGYCGRPLRGRTIWSAEQYPRTLDRPLLAIF
jgi:hypothetical protein